MMDNRLKAAFDSLQADEALKQKAWESVQQKRKKRRPYYGRLVPAFCLLLLCLGFGTWRLYAAPVAHITIDINPSVELQINRWDKVVDVKGLNPDGEALAQSLSVRFWDYPQAVEEILQTPLVEEAVAQGETLAVGVMGDDPQRREEMLEVLASCPGMGQNAYCYGADTEQMEKAQEAGLPCGKYQAFLEWQALDPNATVEQARTMTMSQLRQKIAELSGESQTQAPGWGQGQNQGQGQGQGQGKGWGAGGSGGKGKQGRQ